MSLPSVPVDVWSWAQRAVHKPWEGEQGSCYSIPGGSAMDWTFDRRLCKVS